MTKEILKILIPITDFGKAGGYRVLSELANSWVKLGHEVTFLVDFRTKPPYFPTSAQILYFYPNGMVAKNLEEVSFFKGSWNSLKIYIGMYRALKKIGQKYNVILANFSLTAFPVFFTQLFNKKGVYYIQAYEPEYFQIQAGVKFRVLEFLSKLSYKLPLFQIVNAPIYIDYKNIRAKDWVPPGVDFKIFYKRGDKPLISKERNVILGVIGRSEPTKGVRYALEAFQILSSSDERFELRVAYGNLPNNWVHPRAQIIVPNSDMELSNFYRSIDILIAPGIVQLGACHYPVMEAMACGTPVINTGYFPATLKNSWIVPVESANSIVDSVNNILKLNQDDLQTYLNQAEISIKTFDWKSVSQKFLKIILNSRSNSSVS